RDVVADLVAHHDLGATPDLDVVDDVLAVLRQELGQRSLGLIEVVVGIEHRIGKLAGHIRLLEVSLAVSGNDITTSRPAKTPPREKGIPGGCSAGQATLPGRTRAARQNS